MHHIQCPWCYLAPTFPLSSFGVRVAKPFQPLCQSQEISRTTRPSTSPVRNLSSWVWLPCTPLGVSNCFAHIGRTKSMPSRRASSSSVTPCHPWSMLWRLSTKFSMRIRWRDYPLSLHCPSIMRLIEVQIFLSLSWDTRIVGSWSQAKSTWSVIYRLARCSHWRIRRPLLTTSSSSITQEAISILVTQSPVSEIKVLMCLKKLRKRRKRT